MSGRPSAGTVAIVAGIFAVALGLFLLGAMGKTG